MTDPPADSSDSSSDPSGPGASDPLRRPGFTMFWTAETVSAFGTTITQFALQVLVVITLSGTATEVGLLNAARWLPYLLFGLIVGALVDRWRRQPVLVATDLARAVLLGAIPAMWLLEWLTLPAVLIIVAAFGLISLINDAATQSILPRLVPRSALLAANARLDQSSTVAQTTGPALAGGLVSLIGAPIAVLVDAATYLVSAVLTSRIAVIEPTAPARTLSARAVGRDIAAGLRWTYRHRTLAPLAISTHGWFGFNAVLTTVVVPFALLSLGLTAFQLGLALACAGVGGFVGAALATRLGLRLGAGWAVIACRALTPVATMLILLAPDGRPVVALALLSLGQLVYGFELGASNANEMGYRQAVTPDDLQARMNTTMRSVNRAVVVVGAPLAGVLADSIGYRPTLWVAMVGFVASSGWLVASPLRHARHTDQPPGGTQV